MKLRQKILRHCGLFLILTLVCFFGLSQMSYATDQKSLPTAKLPLVVTSCGQSPGVLMVKVLCDRLKLPYNIEDLLTAKILQDQAKKNIPYRTMIITMGTSLKGMGAAGINIDSEVSRIKAVIEEAKKQEILIIGAHIEGLARRADVTDERSIDAVAANSSLLIVRADGNKDGLFTKIAEKHIIPLIEIEKTLDLGEVLKKLFQMDKDSNSCKLSE